MTILNNNKIPRKYYLFSTPEEIHCDTLELETENFSKVFEIMAQYCESDEEKKYLMKNCVDILKIQERCLFPPNLSKFGEPEPTYNDITVINPHSCSVGIQFDGINFTIYTVDIPDPSKYALVGPNDCLCFSEPFYVKLIGTENETITNERSNNISVTTTYSI